MSRLKSKLVESRLQESENDTIVKAFEKEFQNFRTQTLVSPVLNVVEALPKEEMAAMAEALVELTALRRKVGSNLETVGGPTDVAIISKGEGLIWMKRKHYFDPELNGDFHIRKQILLGEN